MLKTKRGSNTYLVTQPAHAELAGTLAAHWGNGEFSRPGTYAPSSDPERLRREVILAVDQHDNGWWEWEAAPAIADEDGMPQDLREVLKDPLAGTERWRLGVPRLAQQHPYASLLISYHAWWLYAAQFREGAPEQFTHQLQREHRTYPAELASGAQKFLAEIKVLQDRLVEQMADGDLWADALLPQHLKPHVRLLQTLDAVSLALCSNVITPAGSEAKGLGQDRLVFENVPRRDWNDRVAMQFIPGEDADIRLDPYPFDEAPLRVSVPARVIKAVGWWRETPLSLLNFTFVR